jgi:serine/threonine protein kinase
MNDHMIGKVLKGHYQIVQGLGAGVFGQTYIAIDLDRQLESKYVIKQLKVTNNQPSYLQTLRLRFMTESQTMKQLGKHNQIPELIDCFEDNERFYLVQEYIEGHSLTAELPIHQRWGYIWSEPEVIAFLKDVLEILKFIHNQGIVHCDIKPENLIRRASDGKLVLIDFGSIQPVDFTTESVLPIYRIPVTSLGYIPPEQFVSQPNPSSDIYSLGLVAIQALTGLSPLQLKTEPNTNEVLWRFMDTPVSDYLAAILSKMIRHNYRERYESADDLIRTLKQMPQEINQFDVEYSVYPESGQYIPKRYFQDPSSGKSSPLLTGMKVGLAANSLVMAFGAYSLLNHNPGKSGIDALYQAKEEYQSGDLDKAIALAKSIPSHSNVYPEAQASIEEWQQQWQIAAEKFKLTEKAFNQKRWGDAVRLAAQVPDIRYWQTKSDILNQEAQARVEITAKEMIAKAYEKASEKDFSAALHYLQQVPKESSTIPTVKQKINEYNYKQQIRASYFLQLADKQADEGNLVGAVQMLEGIPYGTHAYGAAQMRLIEYNQKLRLEKEEQKIAQVNESNHITSFIKSAKTTKIKDFQADNFLSEVNINNP